MNPRFSIYTFIYFIYSYNSFFYSSFSISLADLVLQRDFTTTSINEKWVGDITYIHTTIDAWCYLDSVLDLHSKKIIGYAFGKIMTNNLVIKALKFKRV